MEENKEGVQYGVGESAVSTKIQADESSHTNAAVSRLNHHNQLRSILERDYAKTTAVIHFSRALFTPFDASDPIQ